MTGNLYPDANLVRIVRGRYVEGIRPEGEARALDVGCGGGGNLFMLAESGFRAHGLEVSASCGEAVARHGGERGLDVKVGLLEGTRLPYPDEHFHLVVSWGAVYYYGSRTPVRAAIEDFHRVLVPGGILLLAVTHPNCFMAARLSGDLGDGRHRIEVESAHDNRRGSYIFYDATSAGWRALLEPFADVAEGYTESDLFDPARRVASRLFCARKGL